MKRRINTIKGKRLVTGGDTNTLTKDEILVTEAPNGVILKERTSNGNITQLSGSCEGQVNSPRELYYKIIGPVEPETFGRVLKVNSVIYEGRLIQYAVQAYSSNVFIIDVANIIGVSQAIAIRYDSFNTISGGREETDISFYTVPEGNLIEKVIGLVTKDFENDFGRELTKEEKEALYNEYFPLLKESLDKCLVEITKEEYESMITVK